MTLLNSIYRLLNACCCNHAPVCRVKELGPGGPVEGKPAEIERMSNNNAAGALSPQNSDLYMLRTTNVSDIGSGE